MTELQYGGLIALLAGALPSYLLSLYIEKGKRYSLFSGWDPSKMSDEDAYGKLLCKGLKGFALVMALGCTFTIFGFAGVVLFIVSVVILPLIPLIYYLAKAKRCHGV